MGISGSSGERIVPLERDRSAQTSLFPPGRVPLIAAPQETSTPRRCCPRVCMYVYSDRILVSGRLLKQLLAVGLGSASIVAVSRLSAQKAGTLPRHIRLRLGPLPLGGPMSLQEHGFGRWNMAPTGIFTSSAADHGLVLSDRHPFRPSLRQCGKPWGR